MSLSDRLLQATVRGTLWNYGIFALSKGGIFLSTLVLARLLTPQDFGLIALGLLAISYLDTLNDCGIGSALIYHQDNPERAASVAFFLNITMSLLITSLACIAAPQIATFFNEPRITPIIRVLALSFILSGLRNIQESRLKKELDFQRRLKPELGKTLAKSFTAIALAWWGYGVWSLVWGQLAGAVVSTLLYWRVSPWRPQLIFDLKTARNLLGYGLHIVFIGILGIVTKNLDTLIIGHRMDAIQLGYYTLALQLPQIAMVNLCYIVSQALFPAYAKLQHNSHALCTTFVLSLRYLSIILMPIGLGLYLVAPDFVSIFYSEQWSPIIPVIQMLALHAVLYSLSFNVGDLYKAIGRPGILNKISSIALPLTAFALWIASGWSIYAIAVAQVLTTLTLTVIRWLLASRVLSIKLGVLLSALKPALLSASIMFLTISAIRSQLTSSNSVFNFFISITLGILIYISSIWLVNREIIREGSKIFQSPDKQYDYIDPNQENNPRNSHIRESISS